MLHLISCCSLKLKNFDRTCNITFFFYFIMCNKFLKSIKPSLHVSRYMHLDNNMLVPAHFYCVRMYKVILLQIFDAKAQIKYSYAINRWILLSAG